MKLYLEKNKQQQQQKNKQKKNNKKKQTNQKSYRIQNTNFTVSPLTFIFSNIYTNVPPMYFIVYCFYQNKTNVQRLILLTRTIICMKRPKSRAKLKRTPPPQH